MKDVSMVISILLVCGLALSGVTFSSYADNHSEVMNNTADYLVINEVYYGDNNNTDSGWWIEIYNPTNRLFNLTALTYLDIDCLSILPPDDPTVLFHPHEYVLFCGSAEKLNASWDIPSGTKIIELDYFGRDIVMIITSDDATNEPASGNYHDVMGDGWGEESYHYPLPPSHHSWARYRGGYDTDNFTDDFYDEPNPTPGYENNLGKNPTNPSPPANLTATLSYSNVNLTWNPPSNDGNATITEYRIYRGTSPDSLELMASVNGSTTGYMDANVSAGITYYYSVSAVNPIGEGNLSEAVSIEIPENEAEPAPYPGVLWMIGAMAFAAVLMKRKKRNE